MFLWRLSPTFHHCYKAVVRTNTFFCAVEVDALADTVYHYGKAGSVNVISANSASYHENGNVPFLEVKGGHIVLEKAAKVSAVHFAATGNTFTNEDGKAISIGLSKVSGENIPGFSRDNVEIAEQGTYVAKVTSGADEYIWLWGNGTQAEMVVFTSSEAIAESDGGDGYQLKPEIVAGTEDGTVADQIANNAVTKIDPQTGTPKTTYGPKTSKEEA